MSLTLKKTIESKRAEEGIRRGVGQQPRQDDEHVHAGVGQKIRSGHLAWGERIQVGSLMVAIRS